MTSGCWRLRRGFLLDGTFDTCRKDAGACTFLWFAIRVRSYVSAYSTWPAVWEVGADWPNNGTLYWCSERCDARSE